MNILQLSNPVKKSLGWLSSKINVSFLWPGEKDGNGRVNHDQTPVINIYLHDPHPGTGFADNYPLGLRLFGYCAKSFVTASWEKLVLGCDGEFHIPRDNVFIIQTWAMALIDLGAPTKPAPPPKPLFTLAPHYLVHASDEQQFRELVPLMVDP